MIASIPYSSYDELFGLGKRAKERREQRRKNRSARKQQRQEKRGLRNQMKQAEIDEKKMQTAMLASIGSEATGTGSGAKEEADEATIMLVIGAALTLAAVGFVIYRRKRSALIANA